MLPPGGRRSKIRPPRKSLIATSVSGTGADSQLEYEKSWSVLSNSITQIQNKNVSNLSYEQLYRKAYILVLRKYGARLYDNVSMLIRTHLLRRREILLETSGNNETFMKRVIVEWEEHLQSMKFISDVLMYLNRVYVKENKKLLIYDLGVELFKDFILKHNDNEVGSNLIDIVIEEITRNRDGEVITTKAYITKIISMFEVLTESFITDIQYGENYYQRYFEPKFLSSSETFFNRLARDLMNSKLGSRYLLDASEFITNEEKRVNFYLPECTNPKLIDLMNNILVKDKIDYLISLPFEQEGLSFLLEPVISSIFDSKHTEHHFTELRILYDFMGRVDHDYRLLKLRIREQILKQGARLPSLVKSSLEMSNADTPKKGSSNTTAFATKWIESILKFQDQYNLILDNSFCQDFELQKFVSVAIKDFVSGPANGKKSNDIPNSPELLSVFLDHSIKQHLKASTNSSTDSRASKYKIDFLEKSIDFLKYLGDKDAFEAHYANHFAKRFLNSKGTLSKLQGNKLDENIEELVISKFSGELGASSLDKVIRMNKDIKSSYDVTMEWGKFRGERKIDEVGHQVEMELKICNVTDWPKSMTKDYKNFSNDSENNSFVWPRQLRHLIKDFTEFWYSGRKNDNKTLYWTPKFGSMDLRVTYPSRTYDISMSTYAGVVMLLFSPQSTNPDGTPVSAFDEMREFTFSEIKELTGIPDADLRRQLQSIAVAPRSRLLVKTPMSKEVNDTDTFKLNSAFKSPSPKVKVLTVSASTPSASSKSSASNSQGGDDAEDISSLVLEGRKIEINAAIVRIMKSRHTVNHNELVAEIVKQLGSRFQPSIILIKQRIEDLIEKEYLKRDEEDKSLYRYVA